MKTNKEGNYKEVLKNKMDDYVHFIYRITKTYPSEELFGSVSQIRRASLFVILNYIEGYARIKPLVQFNFFETAYGSLKESKYLLHFSLAERYISQPDYRYGLCMADEIGAMLWTEITSLSKVYKQ